MLTNAGDHLRFCDQESTCCTESMEAKLSNVSRHQYDLVVRESTSKLHKTFTNNAKKFNGTPTDLFHSIQFPASSVLCYLPAFT